MICESWKLRSRTMPGLLRSATICHDFRLLKTLERFLSFSPECCTMGKADSSHHEQVKNLAWKAGSDLLKVRLCWSQAWNPISRLWAQFPSCPFLLASSQFQHHLRQESTLKGLEDPEDTRKHNLMTFFPRKNGSRKGDRPHDSFYFYVTIRRRK